MRLTSPARAQVLALMSLRVFTALPIPDEVADIVEPLLKGVPGANWRPRDNFHITLAFYGELDEPVIEELDHELARIDIPPFALKLKGANHFGKNEPGSLWLGVEAPPQLDDLARQCRKAARRVGVAVEKRKYIPHMTVAYIDRDELDLVKLQRFEQRLGLFETDPFIADRFYLQSSYQKKRGPNEYPVEAEYPLAHPTRREV